MFRTSDLGAPTPIRWQQLSGLAATIGLAVAIELLAETIFRVPTPGAVLSIGVAYAAFTGGRRTGFASVIIVVLYMLHFFAAPGELITTSIESLEAAGVLAISTAAMVFMIGSLQDRYRRTAAQLQARIGESEAAEERYRLLFANHPHPMWVYDLETLAFLEVNAAAVNQYGYSREEFLQMRITDIRPPEDVSQLLDQIARRRPALQRSGDWRHRRKNGQVFDVQITSHTLEFAGRRAALVVADDVTVRKRAEAALRESEDRYRHLVELSPESILVLEGGTIIYSNPAGADLLGAETPSDLIGLSIWDVVHPAYLERARERMRLVIEQGQQADLVEEQFVRLDRQIIDVEVVAIPITYRDSPAAQVVVRDITQRKRAEEQVHTLHAELERRVVERTAQLDAVNRELEAFSYSVSHDLRAPLRSIDGFSQALIEDYGAQLDGLGSDYLRRVRAAGQRMARLIDDLLSLSRVTRSELGYEAVQMSEIARTIAQELQQAHPERRVDVRIAEGLTTYGDSGLLRVVLENLLGNAWKFTSRQPSPQIEFAATQQDGQLVFYVRDNGAGFDRAYADKLFGAFQRLHDESEYPGTGIGLATVQRIINRHNGRIWAEGAVGYGATFYFTL